MDPVGSATSELLVGHHVRPLAPYGVDLGEAESSVRVAHVHAIEDESRSAAESQVSEGARERSLLSPWRVSAT
jgi:hypothetical protein